MNKTQGKTIAVIPARGGSKRIVNKNIKLFSGKPLISYSIEAALKAEIFDKIIVSTDSGTIADIAIKYGAEVPFMRPQNLADDYCPVGEVLTHAVKFLEETGLAVDYACCIYATAPMVLARDISHGLHELQKAPNFSSALAVTTFEFPIQRALRIEDGKGLKMIQTQHQKTRSQDLETCYHDAGQFFWRRCKPEVRDRRMGSLPIFIDRLRVQDIDTPEDWRVAECQLRVLKLLEEEGLAHV